MAKQKPSIHITEHEDYNVAPNTVKRSKPIGWKCGAKATPPLHKIALKNREERLRKKEEGHG